MITLQGWHCRQCGAFNGEEKDKRETCRSCGNGKQKTNPLTAIRHARQNLDVAYSLVQRPGHEKATRTEIETAIRRLGEVLSAI